MTCFSSGRPARGCRTLGSSECIRLPWPAARIVTKRGRLSFFAMIVVFGPGPALPPGNDCTVSGPPARALERGQSLPDASAHPDLRVGMDLVLGRLAALNQLRRLPECLFQGFGTRYGILQKRLAEIGEVAVVVAAERAVSRIG